MLSWIKRNKLASILLLIIIIWLVRQATTSFLGFNIFGSPQLSRGALSRGIGAPAEPGVFGLGQAETERLSAPDFYPPVEYPPQSDRKERLVIKESEFSLLVQDVVEVRNNIVVYAQANGGYMVSSTVSNPEDQPTATVVVRVQSSKLEDALNYFHSLAIKVVSENLLGQDVTDQYVDVEKRIAILEKTKTRLEEILSQAREISDITNLNQQIINTQGQIDGLIGQQEALKQNAQLAKMTIYLSTDEIALPYAPSETFRPGVIFKLAVRSLVGKLRLVATLGIWVVAYAVLWVPAALLVLGISKKLKMRSRAK